MKENTGDAKDKGRGLILADMLRSIYGRVTLKVVERVGDLGRTWTLTMHGGLDMLKFLRDDAKLVDGPLLLNCDVDRVVGSDDNGIVVLIVFGSEGRDDA